MPRPALINCESLTKSFGGPPLFEGLTFALHEGDHLALVGPNGAGKSTLLKILGGLETADSGSCTRRKGIRVGHVPQTPVFAPGRAAEEIVAEAVATDHRLDDHERDRCVSQALTDALYPAWMKTLAARGSSAVSLMMADGFSDAVPETQRVSPDVVEVSGGGLQLRPVTVSVYGGGTDLHVGTYADLLALDAGRAQFHLKRAPGRVFFTWTDAGWLQL